MRKPAAAYIALFAALHFVQGASYAQLPDYQVKMLTEQQGLKPAEFISLARDADGFLWLLSPHSVQRYDGQKSWSFPAPNGADELLIDRQARVWLLARRQVLRFVNHYKGFEEIPVAGEEFSTVCLFYARGELYLLLANGFQQFDEKKGRFEPVRDSPFPPGVRFSTVYGDNDDFLFLASADSIYSLHLETFQLRATPFENIAGLTALSGNRVIASDQELKSFIVTPGTGKQEITPKQLGTQEKTAFIRIYNAVPLGNEQYHLTSTRGLLNYDALNDRFTAPNLYYRGEKLTNTLSVRRIFRDRAGTVFVTMADGVAFYHPHRSEIQYIRNYQHGNTMLPEMDIRSFAEDDQGNLWIATLNGLARLHLASGELKTFLAGEEHSISYPSLRHVVFHRGRLYVGTGGKGVWLYDAATSRFERPLFTEEPSASTLNEEFAWRVQPLQRGDVFIAGGGSSYIIKPDLQVNKLDKTVFTGNSRTAFQDSAGRIWHGTATGINCANADFKLLFRVRDTFPDNRIAAFYEWKKDRMLIGTRGLFEIACRGDSMVSIQQLHGIPAERFVFAMEQDGAGNIWIGTDEGLFRYDPVNDQAVMFDMADHVQPQTFNSNGLYRARSGRMYAGGKGGMNMFDPGKLEPDVNLLRPLITSFAIGRDDSTYFLSEAPYSIRYANRILTATISAPEFEQPHALRYRYRTNADEEWLENGNSPLIQLHNFHPGEYDLQVAVSNDGVNWNTSAQHIAFVIRSPWWEQWWFRLSILLGLGAAVYGIVRNIRKRKERKRHQAIVDYFASSNYEHLSVEHILWDIAMNCISRMGFEECVIYVLDHHRNVLVQKAAYGPKSPHQFEIRNPIEIPVGKGITGTVAQTGVAEIVNNTAADPRYLVDDEPRRSEITVPILFEGKVIGIIDSENSQRNFFTKEHLQTLTTIAGICSVKIAHGMSLAEMKKTEMMVSDLNTKMLEAKYQNLRLQMNPHFLFNSLSSIQHLVVSQQTNEAYTYLSVFSNFLRMTLQHADDNVITLEEEVKMLDMYIKLERLGSDKAFNFTIDLDESLDAEDVLVPPLMIQPVIENAIWHGLMPKKGDKNLSVSFRNQEDDYLVCIVDDNGIGRPAAAANKKAMSSFTHQSKAMGLIEERLQLLQQKSGKPAAMHIEDKHVNGTSLGTRVTIILPYYNPGEL